MVIRVYPDGRPVPEDQKRPLPKDEDVDELKYSRLPSIEEIEAKSGSTFYGKGANEPSTAKRRMFFAADDKNYRRQEALRLRGHSLPYERVFRGALNERRVRYYWGNPSRLFYLDARYLPAEWLARLRCFVIMRFLKDKSPSRSRGETDDSSRAWLWYRTIRGKTRGGKLKMQAVPVAVAVDDDVIIINCNY